MANDAAAPLVKQIFNTKEELLGALNSSNFYLELMFVVLAVVLAELMVLVINRRIRAYLASHPPRRISPELVSKAITLFAPLLSFILLGALKPLSAQYAESTTLVDAGMQLCVAIFTAKLVLLLVESRLVAWFIAFVIVTVSLLDVTGFMGSTTAYLEASAFQIGKFKITMLNMVHGLVILVVVFWGAGLLSRTLEGYLRRSSTLSYSARELIVKFFNIFIYFVALMITLSAVGVDLTAFAVFGGALGVGIGLGLQKVTANFVSGITLLLEKSIKLGDLIEVGGNTGHVRAMNIRYALVETSDGRELLVPNEELTSTRVTNWTHSNEQARIEVKATVHLDTDVKKALAIMLECAKAHPRCISQPKPVCWLREFSTDGLVLLLAFWIADVHEGRNTPQSEVMLAILDKFREAGISFAIKADMK